MKHLARQLIVIAALAGVAACGRSDDGQVLEDPPTVLGDDNAVPPQPMVVEGCLTASGDRFVLTELAPGAPGPTAAEQRGEVAGAKPEPTTETYRLVGMTDELRPHVNQRVEISGEAEPEHVVDMRRVSPPLEAQGTPAAGTSGPDATVTTVEAARIEISDLLVRSVRALGQPCP